MMKAFLSISKTLLELTNMLRRLKNRLSSEFDIDGMYRVVFPSLGEFLLSIWNKFRILAFEWNYFLVKFFLT